MTDRMREGRALVQPGNDSLPYSDPVPAAPAAAGRELDALVAEKVMGVPRYQIAACMEGIVLPLGYDEKGNPLSVDTRIANYSTEIAAAWLVVEQMLADNWNFDIDKQGASQKGDLWCACFDRGEPGKRHTSHCKTGDSAPHAICLAALSLASTNRAADLGDRTP